MKTDYIIGVKTIKVWFCVDITTSEEMTQEKAEYIGKRELNKLDKNAVPLEIKYKLKPTNK